MDYYKSKALHPFHYSLDITMKKIILFSIWFCLFGSFASPVFSEGNNTYSGSIKYSCHNWLPMSYKTDEGFAGGLYIDILTEVFTKELNIPLAIKFSSWQRAQVEVKKGVTDFLITVATEDRLKYTEKSSEPFFLLYLYVYTYTGHPLSDQIDLIETPEDIIKLNLKTVTNIGNGWHKSNMEAKGVQTHYVRLEDSALSFLAAKRADIMIDALISTNHIIREKKLASKIRLTKSRFGPLKMHLLMSKKSSFLKLMPKIDRTFKKLQDEGVIKEIITRYSSLKQPEQFNQNVFAGDLK